MAVEPEVRRSKRGSGQLSLFAFMSKRSRISGETPDRSDTAETGLLGEGSMEASDSDTGSEFPANSMSSGIIRSDESCLSSTGSATTSRSSVPEVPSDLSQDKMGKPMQPKICFPNRSYGSTARSFQASWYNDYSWIEYSQEKDAAFCFCCRFFNVTGIPADPAFTQVGFRDWKHACGRKGSFASHASSHAHKSAMLNWQQFKLNVVRGTTVGARLDQEGRKVINSNRHYVKALTEAILVCAQQGIALKQGVGIAESQG